MSSVYNNLFKQDPIAFVDRYTVDIKTWFEGLMRAPRSIGMALWRAADALKVGRFDLAPVGGFLGMGVNTVQVQMIPSGNFIDAYWVPYHAGLGLPGYADVPRRNPACNFVFTAGMNGCAFVVTDSPGGGQYMRVYHNQHPQDNRVWRDIHLVGQNVISYADFNDYGGGQLGPGMNPVAFNFLYYRNGEWMYVFQPQAFNALSQTPARRLVGQASHRSVF